jgi:hypothetical protein
MRVAQFANYKLSVVNRLAAKHLRRAMEIQRPAAA